MVRLFQDSLLPSDEVLFDLGINNFKVINDLHCGCLFFLQHRVLTSFPPLGEKSLAERSVKARPVDSIIAGVHCVEISLADERRHPFFWHLPFSVWDRNSSIQSINFS
jgi:hypothetical protein